MKRVGRFYVYIVECRDGTYYTGYTPDIERRVKLHNAGKGAKYTRGRAPVKVVYAKGYRHRGDALRAEISVKRLNHEEKLGLAKIFGRG